MRFLKELQVNNNYVYREQLQQNARKGQFKLEVLLEDIKSYDTRLGDCLRVRPSEYIPAVRLFSPFLA
jgi:hypothetical protein